MTEPAPDQELFTEERSAQVVAASFDRTPDPRLKQILQSLTSHLHPAGNGPAHVRSIQDGGLSTG